MIAKISSSANLAGALGYNFKKVNTGGASVLLAEGLYENPDSAYTLLEVLSNMLAFIPPKCRTKNLVFHCSLNPHPKEKLTDEDLIRIAREYMQALGYGSQPYIVFKHHDIEREHIKMRISRTPKGTPQIVSVQSRILPNERIYVPLHMSWHLTHFGCVHSQVLIQ